MNSGVAFPFAEHTMETGQFQQVKDVSVDIWCQHFIFPTLFEQLLQFCEALVCRECSRLALRCKVHNAHKFDHLDSIVGLLVVRVVMGFRYVTLYFLAQHLFRLGLRARRRFSGFAVG